MAIREVDWVKNLSDCSLKSVWAKLKVDVRLDVDKRMALRPADPQYGFELNVEPDYILITLIGRAVLSRSVKFTLSEKAISITDESDRKLFDATLTLDDNGECIFKVNDQEKQSWQIRKMALEGLLFGSIWR